MAFQSNTLHANATNLHIYPYGPQRPSARTPPHRCVPPFYFHPSAASHTHTIGGPETNPTKRALQNPPANVTAHTYTHRATTTPIYPGHQTYSHSNCLRQRQDIVLHTHKHTHRPIHSQSVILIHAGRVVSLRLLLW